MLSLRQRRPARTMLLAPIGLLAALALGGAGVWAQANPSPPAAPVDQNCAVSTARIGGVDVTEFFGVRGGASGFAQNFAAPATSSGPTGQPGQILAQRCIRLEVENPTPGDLVPAGGYTLGGFTFDPSSGPDQGAGISAVQIFLDDPNQGGFIVGQTGAGSESTGSAGFGLPSARGAAFGDQFANSGFHLTIQIPSSAAGSPHALVVLAQSRTGRIGTVAIPVVVGNLTPAVPTRTP